MKVDPSSPPPWPVAIPIGGTVYGVALNSRAQRARLAGALDSAPYHAPPRAPVLYIKTPNAFRAHDGVVPVPAECPHLTVAPSLAIVMGRNAFRLLPDDALDHVLGYALAIDVSEPGESLFRPPVRRNCRDGFLPIGPWIVQANAVAAEDWTLDLTIGGAPGCAFSAADLVRPIPQLLADVTEFMTLAAGDVLLAGLPDRPPEARIGDRVSVRAAGIGALACRLVAEAEAARWAA